MKDMERQKFEGGWQEAFGKAEITPSENLWTNIELDLVKAEGEKMKRRVLFYKLMAAASITFAMCVAGVGTYFYKNPSSGYIAANTRSKITTSIDAAIGEAERRNELSEEASLSDKEVQSANSIQSRVESNDGRSLKTDVHADSKNNFTNNEIVGTQNSQKQTSNEFGKSKSIEKNAANEIQSNGLERNRQFGDNENISVENKITSVADNDFTDEHLNNGRNVNSIVQKPALTALLASEKIKYKPQQNEVDPVLVMMARLEQRELELRDDRKTSKEKKKAKNTNENLWTSFGFAAGSFTSANSNVNSLTSNLNQSSNSLSAARTADVSKDVASKQSKASGISYSMGLSIGTKVSERWIVQGGVNYLTQTSSYETTAINRNGEQSFSLFTIKDAAKSSDPKVTSTAPYNVSSNLQFVSVPLQAGYMALKRKFGVQINTGVSTELFLQSVSSAVVNNKSTDVKDGWGDQSPYRTVNFSGLFGTEFSYRFGIHYRVALNPGLRYPFSSIYKTEIGVKAIPLTVDVGLKLRYIFN